MNEIGEVVPKPSDSNNPRRVAVHEAGHAVASWAVGIKVHKIELAEGDKPLVWTDGSLHPDVAAWVIHSSRIDENVHYYPPKNETDQQAFRYYKSSIELELSVSFAGVVAESTYTGEDAEILLTKGGKSDAKNILMLLAVLKKMGVNEAEIDRIRTDALNQARLLVSRYQWEIIGIAMILAQWEVLWGDEFYSYMMLFTKRDLRPAV
ncbi:hypothetical protein [Citrobacter portucalensis]|uniref:hypothetical protein n=1 Tax=Citrobacter portucalensis TaxID=1639133 RepID=UPI00226B9DC0|nr:hypothetical protein [Citrobacter portucalensis]MCX9070644.1 M50 family metallopeptidase [Citrobacter portucalensis]